MKHAAPEPARHWLRRRSGTVVPDPELVDVSSRLSSVPSLLPAGDASEADALASEPAPTPEPQLTPAAAATAAGQSVVWWHHPAATVLAAREVAVDDLEVDLRDGAQVELPTDTQSVLERLARLRDAGLMTPAEYEDERRALLRAPVDR